MRGRKAKAGSATDGRDAVPVAQRMSPARWTDRRLWSGLALLVVSAVAGALLLSRSDGSATVWRATRDLSVGAPAVDLEPVRVDAGLAESYVAPGDALSGVLRMPVRAGELVPIGALGVPVVVDTRRVSVPVDPVRAPAVLQPGDRVDVWSTPQREGMSDASPPRLVLSDVAIAAVTTDVGLSGEVGIELDVPVDAVAAVVGAARSGAIDLVAVPVDAQEPVA